MAKGHNYITLFVDLLTRRTIHITNGKDSQTIDDFTKILENKKGNPEQITNVSCDMSPAFIKGVREQLPNAKITFDKFHIIKIINEDVDVDHVRRKEVANNPLLKETRYVFLKNNENLTAWQITSDDKSCENNQASLGGHYMVHGKQNK